MSIPATTPVSIRYISPPGAPAFLGRGTIDPLGIITVTEATGEGEHGHGEEAADVTEVAAEAASSTSEGDGNGSGLAVVGIVVGALGLATGGAALARSRKPAA